MVNKQLSTMSINYDVTKDLRYLEGKEIGIDLGIDLGIASNTKALIKNMLSWANSLSKKLQRQPKFPLMTLLLFIMK